MRVRAVVARQTHNLKVGGSSPSPATTVVDGVNIQMYFRNLLLLVAETVSPITGLHLPFGNLFGVSQFLIGPES